MNSARLTNFLVRLIGDFNKPIEIHSSSSKSCCPLTRDFELLNILNSEPTISRAINLNLDYIKPMKSIVTPTSVNINHPEFCQEHIYDTAITIID